MAVFNAVFVAMKGAINGLVDVGIDRVLLGIKEVINGTLMDHLW